MRPYLKSLRLPILLAGLGMMAVLVGTLWYEPVHVRAATDTAAGAGKSALTISPAIVEHVTEPGEKKTYTLRLTNITDFPLPISGTVKSFFPLEEIQDPRMRALYDASAWFDITEPDFILQARQTRTVSVSITLPTDAEPGGHYATVYFQPLLPADVLTPSTAYLTARVGSLAFLIVPGDLDEKLSVASFSTPRFHGAGPVNFSASLKNTGKVHLAPNSKIVIRNMFGTQTASIGIDAGVVLPGTQKQLSAAWKSPGFFGRYTATYQAAYGADNRKLPVETVSFWVVPWLFLSLVIMPVLVVATVAVRTRGRWKRAWRILRGQEY